MELELVNIQKPTEVNVILGMSHFIKTVEDLHEAMVTSVPGIEFGLAFCEASGPRLIRLSGTSDEMVALASENASKLAAGHSFVVFLANAFPINVLNAIKAVPEVCRIFCATANEVQVVVVETEQGRGIVGVVDGEAAAGVEDDAQTEERKKMLRNFGYKLG